MKFAGARAHQVDQVQVVLQVGKDLDLAQQGRELRSIERVVDRLHRDLRDGARIKEALGLADVDAAEVAAAQQLPDLKLRPGDGKIRSYSCKSIFEDLLLFSNVYPIMLLNVFL